MKRASEKRPQNLYLFIMASTSKAFRQCMHPCRRYLTPDDTHSLCVSCLGEEHTRNVLEGAFCVHCERFSMKKLRSRLSLFSRKEGQPSASRGSGPAAAEARKRMTCSPGTYLFIVAPVVTSGAVAGQLVGVFSFVCFRHGSRRGVPHSDP